MNKEVMKRTRRNRFAAFLMTLDLLTQTLSGTVFAVQTGDLIATPEGQVEAEALQAEVPQVSDSGREEATGTSTQMFDGCSVLVGGKGTAYEEGQGSSYAANKARVDKGVNEPGFFTDIKDKPASAKFSDNFEYTARIIISGDNKKAFGSTTGSFTIGVKSFKDILTIVLGK